MTDAVTELIELTNEDLSRSNLEKLEEFAEAYQEALKRALRRNHERSVNAAYELAFEDSLRVRGYVTGNEDVTTQVHRLAVVLCDKFYPAEWGDDGFALAVGAVAACLCDESTETRRIYPIQWPRVCFDIENIIARRSRENGGDMNERLMNEGLMLCGMDPLSKSNNTDRFLATGIAFHLPGAQNNNSQNGMRSYYGIDCTGDNPLELLNNNVVLVNMIRTIPQDGKSGGGNPHHGAWLRYTVWFLKQFPNSHTILFNYPFNDELAPIVQRAVRAISSANVPTSDVPVMFWPKISKDNPRWRRRIVAVMDHPWRVAAVNPNRQPVNEVLGIDAFTAIYSRLPRESVRPTLLALLPQAAPPQAAPAQADVLEQAVGELVV